MGVPATVLEVGKGVFFSVCGYLLQQEDNFFFNRILQGSKQD